MKIFLGLFLVFGVMGDFFNARFSFGVLSSHKIFWDDDDDEILYEFRVLVSIV